MTSCGLVDFNCFMIEGHASALHWGRGGGEGLIEGHSVFRRQSVRPVVVGPSPPRGQRQLAQHAPIPALFNGCIP